MKYILQNTDIFDEEIGTKFNTAIKTDKEKIDKGKIYKFTVSFHVNLLNDSRAGEFYIPEPSKTNKGSKEDRIYDVMSTQLKRLEQTLNENGIEAYSTKIQGDRLEKENIIEIEINEDNSEPKFTGKGKNKKKKKIKVSSIVPSLPYTQENVTKLASERLSKIFYDYMNIIRDKKIMSEILGIDETGDDRKLIKAFVEQYGELWLTTSEKEKDLRNRFKERSLLVLNKYIAIENQIDKSQ